MEVDSGNGSRARLTRDRICEAALTAIDAHGLESVSMRMLAGALGVKASSLYHHFGSKDELMTGVAEYLYRALGRPPTGDDWADQVKGTFVQLRDFIQAHPNAAPLLVRDLASSPVAKKRANVLLRLVSRAGLDPVDSAGLVGNLVALLVGHSLLAAWVQEETGVASGVEAGRSGSVDPARPWVQRLFKPDPPDPRPGRAPGSVGGGRTGAELASLRGAARQSPGAGTIDSEEALPSSADSLFLAGLDALITGYAAKVECESLARWP